ncbi:hypothetical protein DACRYDRAFT_20813 [Dacryopinax primogenitus]|uniref:C2H2-type domain-containing protein n=1 Tax=Dacryopinax primogenitus (strain DJM 731) TaxID=1858805 RepID=M5GFL2_DACPD|nr:uncharacterized protein DACRYDRAFT_20813 [Dacryopinax primogenitus]EJU04203.1 hypothetical protein DACRYDRAFT_20813 [Dacryopinax primogenitus]
MIDPATIVGPSIPIVRITKTYRCSSCPKVFTSSGHLQRHGRVHSGEKQFTCPYPDCNKQCNRQDNLLQHYKIHLPRSDRNRGPEYLNMVFAEMVASQALSAAHRRVRPKSELHINVASSKVASVTATAKGSPVSDGETSALHILAASALSVRPSVALAHSLSAPATGLLANIAHEPASPSGTTRKL